MEQDQEPDHLQLLRALRKTYRNQVVIAAWLAGVSKAEIRRQTGMSLMTIDRIIKPALAPERVGD